MKKEKVDDHYMQQKLEDFSSQARVAATVNLVSSLIRLTYYVFMVDITQNLDFVITYGVAFVLSVIFLKLQKCFLRANIAIGVAFYFLINIYCLRFGLSVYQSGIGVYFLGGYLGLRYWLLSVISSVGLARLFIFLHFGVWYLGMDYFEVLKETSLFNFHLVYFAVVMHVVLFVSSEFKASKERFYYQEKIMKQDEQIKNLLSLVSSGLVVINKQEQVVLANQSALDLLGSEVTNFLNQAQYSEIEGDSDFEVVCPLDNISNFWYEEENSKDFGVALWRSRELDLKGSKITWDDQEAILLCINDLTELLGLQREKIESKLKSQLIRAISHDFRTPINTIVNAFNSSELSHNKPVKVRSGRLVVNTAKYLEVLISSMVNFLQSSEEEFISKVEYFDPQEFLYDSVELVQFITENTSKIIKTKPYTGLLTYVRQDRSKLVEINSHLLTTFLQLTSNAIEVEIETGFFEFQEAVFCKFTLSFSSENKEFLDLLVQAIDVPLDMIPSPSVAVINVKIALCILGRLFPNEARPLQYRVENNQVKLKYPLSVETFESSSTDSLVKPCCTNDDEHEFPELPLVPNPAFMDGSLSSNRFSVLVVDDISFNRKIIVELLQLKRIAVQEAESGFEAIQKVKECTEQFNMIIMDLDMPLKNGWETTVEILNLKERGEINSTPVVIAHSSFSSVNDIQKCYEAGMLDYISKPVEKEVFYKKISKWISVGPLIGK